MSNASPPGHNQARAVKARLFASALRNFSQKGFAATSLREIAADADTTKPMIFYYFGSKEHLYAEVVQATMEAAAEAVQEDGPLESTPGERIVSYARRYLAHFIENEPCLALVLREVFGLGGAPMAQLTSSLRERVREPLHRLLVEGMERDELITDDIASCGTAITGILNQFILARVFSGIPVDTDAVIRQVRYYVAGLRSGSPSRLYPATG